MALSYMEQKYGLSLKEEKGGREFRKCVSLGISKHILYWTKAGINISSTFENIIDKIERCRMSCLQHAERICLEKNYYGYIGVLSKF